jgi:fatty-acyl-CoA synthase/long-chain acyl-CoA synthetase
MPDLLTIYAQSQPDKLAVIDDRGRGEPVRWTYAELEDRSNRLANALASLGAGPAQKVIWCGPNSARVVAVISAIRKAGAVAVPLNYRLTPGEALHVINDSDASVAYVDGEHAPMFAALRDRLPAMRHVIVFGGPAPPGLRSDDWIAGMPPEPPAGAAESAGADTMIYTSGTTGKPKGAFRRGRADDGSLAALIGLIGYTPDDVYLAALPQRAGRLPGRRAGLGADSRGAAEVRRRGLAAPRAGLPGDVHVRRARADPDGVRPAGGGQGAL